MRDKDYPRNAGHNLQKQNHTMNTLINKSKVKKFILEFAEANRAHKFSRVSQEAIDRVEAAARAACKAVVTSAPSKGKTL